MNRGGKRRNSGRKPIADKPMKRVNVMLDQRTITKAKELGGDNLSAGIRWAIGRFISSA